MDLGTVDKRLSSGGYTAVDDFVADVRLTFTNCALYNQPGTAVGMAGAKVADVFEGNLQKILANAGAAAAAHKSGGKSSSSTDLVRQDSMAGAEFGMSMKTAKSLVSSLRSHGVSHVFRTPVDPIKLGIPQYAQIITRPMDLSTVNTKLQNEEYATVRELLADINLIWENAITFNGRDSSVGVQANTLKSFTAKKFADTGIAEDAPILSGSALSLAAKAAKGGGGGGGRGGGGGGGAMAGAKRSASGAPVGGGGGSGAVIAGVVDETPVVADSDLVPSADCLIGNRQCLELLKGVKQEPNIHFFTSPVDHIALGIPDYPDVIKKPMDLGTVEQKLERRVYQHPGEFVDDVRLVWSNAKTYNGKGTLVHQAANHIRNVFERNLYMLAKPDVTPPAALMAAASHPAPSLKQPPAPAAAPKAAAAATATADAAPSVSSAGGAGDGASVGNGAGAGRAPPLPRRPRRRPTRRGAPPAARRRRRRRCRKGRRW